jgi:hypothetical protein
MSTLASTHPMMMQIAATRIRTAHGNLVLNLPHQLTSALQLTWLKMSKNSKDVLANQSKLALEHAHGIRELVKSTEHNSIALQLTETPSLTTARTSKMNLCARTWPLSANGD